MQHVLQIVNELINYCSIKSYDIEKIDGSHSQKTFFMNVFAREYARVVPGISYRMFVPSKAVADNMLFQTKTFQRRNIFQWISMNLESFLIALTAITHFRRTHISLFLKLGLQRIHFFSQWGQKFKLQYKRWQTLVILWVPWIDGVCPNHCP